MCTVTFLPTPSGFILTHNRDEAPSRSPEVISRVQEGGDTLLFPRDTKAGGAWVAASKSGRTACLLNGAFVKHHHNPPYRRSRGLVLLDFFHWPQPDLFFGQYDLDGIEPFTFLYFNTDRVVELRWDGTQRYVKELAPDEPHFWCSATLYPPDMQQKRKQVFLDWLQQTVHRPPSSVYRLPSSVYRLHQTGSVGDPENDFVMNRGGRVCTVSITQITLTSKKFSMRYVDLLGGNRDTRSMSMSKR